MKIVAISDTHGQHRKVQLPNADMIIHAGDITSIGTRNQVQDFLDWYHDLDFKYKIFIAGNHDFYLEQKTMQEITEMIPDNIIYLNDTGVIIEGLQIWGSPVQPWFYDWAFNRQRGEDIKKHWDMIPKQTNILITHGPTYGVLDLTTGGSNAGCQDLLNKVDKIRPSLHISGHIHEAYGKAERNGTTFINASVLDLNYKLVNQPIEVEVPNH